MGDFEFKPSHFRFTQYDADDGMLEETAADQANAVLQEMLARERLAFCEVRIFGTPGRPYHLSTTRENTSTHSFRMVDLKKIGD